MKDLGAKAFSYGYASAVMMAATYNDDGTVNVMNLHEVARTNAGDLACCIGKPKKTHENIENGMNSDPDRSGSVGRSKP